MRNNKLMMAALVLILLICAAIGIYVATHPGEQPANHTRSGKLDDGGSLDKPDNETPLKLKPNGPGTAGDNQSTHKDGPDNTGPDKTTGTPGAGDHDTVNKTPEPKLPDPKDFYEPTTVEATIHGRVTFKSDGRAAVGSKVSLELGKPSRNIWTPRRGNSDRPAQEIKRPKGDVSGSAVTDGAGEYTLKVKLKTWRMKPGAPGKDKNAGDRASALPASGDMIVVVATMPGYAPASSVALDVNPGEDKEVNLKLAIPAAVTGRIIDAETRDGIAAAHGTLWDSETWTSGGAVTRDFTTDDQGYFTVNSLPASTYVLSVDADGYASLNGWQAQGRINLGGGGEKDLGEIAMMRAATVIGRVVDGDSGQPVANAAIDLLQRKGMRMATAAGSTDKDGTFKLENVEPGSYTVQVRAPDFALLELQGQTIEPGKTVDLGDLKLDHGLTLTGTVTDSSNQPVDGASVSLREIPKGNFAWVGAGNQLASGNADKDGKYSLSGITIGKFRLVVTAAGFARHEEDIEVTGPGQKADVRLQHGGTVSGRVVDADGAVVPDYRVALISHDTQAYTAWKNQPDMMFGVLFAGTGAETKTGEDGKFSLENVSEGEYLLVAGNPNEALTFKDNVRVKNEREIDVGDIRTGATGSARVTITEDGVPVPELTVKLAKNMGFAGMGDYQAVTDGMGIAFIEKVPAGTYYVRTERDEGTFDSDMLSTRRIEIKAGQVTEKTVELRPAGGVHLHGKLTMNGKATITDIMLIGTGDRSGVVKTAKTVEGGYYELNGIKTGTYVLHARESDTNITARQTLELTRRATSRSTGTSRATASAAWSTRRRTRRPSARPCRLRSITSATRSPSTRSGCEAGPRRTPTASSALPT